MPPNVIPNGKAFAYRGRTAGQALELHRWCIAVSDNLTNRIARHVYLKRDGAEKESMGAGDGAFRFRLNLVGDDCAAQYRAIAQYVRANPRGTLTHPLLGDIKVACEGIEEGSIDVVGASNCVNLALKFTEDAVDSAIAVAEAPAPAQAAGNVTIASSNVRTVVGAVAALASAAESAAALATSYTAAALESWTTGAPDPSLGPALQQTLDSAASLEADIVASTAYRNEATRYPAIVAARNLAASALALDEAVRRSRPAIVAFTVGQTMPLASIAVVLYGAKQAAARMEELRRLNRIPNPFAVSAGTILQVLQAAA